MNTFLVCKRGCYQLLACIAIVVLFLTGCASSPPPSSPPPPSPPPPLPSEALRSQLKKIRISDCTAKPEVEVDNPSGAVGGGAQGFGIGFLYGGLEGLYFGPGVILVAPGLAIYGMVKGVKESQPSTKVEEFDKKFRAAIQELHVADILRQCVADRIQKLKVSEITGPSDQSAPIIMEVVVTKINLGNGVWVSPQDLIITQRTRLIRTADGMELYNNSFGKSGGKYEFDEWFAMDAVKMRKEVEHISQQLAEQIVDEIFLKNQPEENK